MGKQTGGKNQRRQQVLVAGISGNFGRLLTARLHLDYEVIGLDQRPFTDRPRDVLLYQLDARRRKTEDIFRQHRPQALVDLGLFHRPLPGRNIYRELNVVGTIKLLELCLRYQVPKVVLLSTAAVYGPKAENPHFLSEDTPLVGSPDYPEINALIEWDMYAQSFFWKHPHIETVILRPAHVVGPNVRNAPSNYLRLRHPPVLWGFDPLLQLVHEEDLVQALLLALKPGVRGIFNIAGAGQLPLSKILRELGRRPLPLPHFAGKPLQRQLWRLGLSKFPPGELVHLRYQCLIDDRLARQVLGYRPRFDLKQTIHSVEQPGLSAATMGTKIR
jgi:UDP-glucose 4-epimerase